jgi:hypothetical protein
MVRATPMNKVTYKPMEIGEKDPIRRKYGPIFQTTWSRDPATGQIAARELATRFDPNKGMTMYFAKGYPEEKKGFWTNPGGIVDQTNAIFEKAGAKIRLIVKNYDQDIPEDAHPVEKERGREYGDIRYNFIRWMSDLDIGAPFIGVAQFVPDPRTGEALSASINIADFPLKEFVAQRVDAFMSTIMCNASKYDDGLAQNVCTDLNEDKPWGPPMKATKNAEGKFVLEPYPDACQDGQTAEIVPHLLDETYGKSSLYSKMQEYLGEPASMFGPLGPRDFVPNQDDDFHAAYIKTVPYYIFADPATNPFVTPVADGGEFGAVDQYKSLEREVEFHKLTAQLDRGEAPFDTKAGPGFVQQAVGFLDNMQALTLSHRDHVYRKQFIHKASRKLDEAGDLVSFTGVMEKAGRHCVNGHWETKEEWLQKLVQTYHALTVWHEFGHVLGMDHNFMASVDQPNYPIYKAPNCDPNTDPKKCDRVGMYSSSVMEYSTTPDRIFWGNETGGPGWAPYDRGAIAWLYANEGSLTKEKMDEAAAEKAKREPDGVSGQLTATLPWNDPEGFKADGTEVPFLYCNANHTRFTPFCRTGDFGSTPSEIIANEIEAYEWQYAWRNFRKYRKIWDLSNYADAPSKEIIELRRFLPVWRQDWTGDTLRDDFGRFKIPLPANANSKELYYKQLSTKFDDEMSQTNQIVAAFHLALIQQSSGERPFATVIDKFNGDITQQGISLDKQFAMQGWVGLWPSDNYDPNQRGNFISSYGSAFDQEYGAVARKAVASMIGEERFDSFPYLKIAAVVLFAKDTHSPSFTGDNMMKDWVGGIVFKRRDEIWDYFRRRALEKQKYPELGCAIGAGQTTDNPTLETCKYDPMLPRGANTEKVQLSDEFNEFRGPDEHRYAWMEIKDRNQWVFVDKDRNIASYKVVRDYNEKVTKPNEEGDAAYDYLLPVKYYMDAYYQYN